MSTNQGDEEAARLRAAFAYAGLTKAQRAELLGVAPRTVTRVESGQSEVPAGAWPRVIEATGVPSWFASPGFEQDAPSVVERVEALEHRHSTVVDALSSVGRLEEELRLLAARVATVEAEALGRSADRPRASEDPPR